MRARDEGSIMILAIGMTLVVVSFMTTAVNIAALWEQRTALNSLSDGAALAGAQAVDRDAVYTQGLGAHLHLDPAQARSRVRSYVARTSEGSGLEHVVIQRIAVEPTAVTVTVTARARVPFGYLMPSSAQVLRSTARGVNKLR